MRPEPRQVAVKRRAVFNAWFGSLVALFIYLLLPWFVGRPVIPEAEPYRGFRVILWCVAVIQMGALFWWTRRSLNKEAILRAVQGTAINPATYYIARKMAAISLAHSIAVYGLVLAFAGGYSWDQYILTALSAALLMRHYPSTAFLDELERRSEDKSRS